MSGRQRLSLIAVAVLVAAAALVIAKPDDGGEQDTDETTSGAAGQAARAAPRKLADGAPQTPAEEARRPTRIAVRGGEPVGGTRKIEVTSGERVRFTVRSADTTDEIHVHGYDLMKEVGPGRAATFAFAARLEGVFEIELEGAGTEIARLTVAPS
ncbi:MAG: hypothetical protein ACR2GL_07750 [Thermoleophilaceae bacterium]